MSTPTPLSIALESTDIPRLSEFNLPENHKAAMDKYTRSVVFKVLMADGLPFDEANHLATITRGGIRERLATIRRARE